ncbi:MAG: TetR/AcrR family transcriptional regulator [Chromatiales bacterium]|jgi:AcrR family transcriptional regulator|nr:TetR/AcrR family transcriptional regulator [Chromatiales bacterium]
MNATGARTTVTDEASPREDRACAQRNRILNAARCCFIEHGFHAASMAQISAAAQMSAGLIYRYFANKNAIILAIIAHQNEEACADIATLRSSTDLMPRITDLFARWRSSDTRALNPALFLEMCAESSRDPEIARALDAAEKRRGAEICAWIRQCAHDTGHDISEEEAHTRAFTLLCFIDGLAVRAVREPDLAPQALLNSLRMFVPGVVFPER